MHLGIVGSSAAAESWLEISFKGAAFGKGPYLTVVFGGQVTERKGSLADVAGCVIKTLVI